jgi:tRNA (guanine-N7-)-methyltransferase
MVPAGSLSGVHLFFPDPWPKKRHHKSRIVQPAFAALVAARLAPGGHLHFATDWEDYAEHALAVFNETQGLRNAGDGFVARPDTRPETKFERRGLKLGHTVRDLFFTKEPSP